MTNLFNFNYEVETINHKDGSESIFSIVYGQDGRVIHTKTNQYEIVKTQDLSLIGNAFIDQGFEVKPYVYRKGATIGLNIALGERPSVVGEKRFRAYINVPNNGRGMGSFALHEERRVCANGMTRTRLAHKDLNLKIPHTIEYKQALELVKSATLKFLELVKLGEQMDEKFNDKKLKSEEARFYLNSWFYYNEMPKSHRKELSFEKFRELLVVDPSQIKSIARYNELLEAFSRELEYNQSLNLDLSLYTVFAASTNYLTRRLEKSKSTSPIEYRNIKTSKKLRYFEAVKV